MTASTHLLALDQGTSSSRSIVFDRGGRIVAMARREFKQIYPQPGWVEHDPIALWTTQLATAREAMASAGLAARDIAAIGITNQRETTLVWNRRTGVPIHHAIVWQDRRTAAICSVLRERGLEDLFRQRTGLRLDPYFSGTKLKWILDEIPGARAAAERGELAFGTVDTWLLWQLTRDQPGGPVHATDISNASRTLMLDVRTGQWDDELLTALDVPRDVLPQVLPSSHLYGHTQADLFGAPIAIGGVAGDQQSALFGQACFEAGLAKNTYGTGCFMLMHTGNKFQTSHNGLITTSAAQIAPTLVASRTALPPEGAQSGLGRPGAATDHGQPQFALEGSVFVGGAVVQWLRDGLHAIKGSEEVQALAQSVPDSGGVIVVPAFTGLGAPYWKPDARGTITGLTRGSTVAHIARAALESIAYQSAALLQAMSRDAVQAGGASVAELRVDGGACINDLLMQFQADLLGIPVVRPAVTETTALGAAYLAGLTTGVFKSTDELSAMWRSERRFLPTLDTPRAKELMARWEHAVRQTVL